MSWRISLRDFAAAGEMELSDRQKRRFQTFLSARSHYMVAKR